VTKFHRIHPGGSQIILQHAGKAGKAWAMGETGAYHVGSEAQKLEFCGFGVVYSDGFERRRTLKPVNLMERFTSVTHDNS